MRNAWYPTLCFFCFKNYFLNKNISIFLICNSYSIGTGWQPILTKLREIVKYLHCHLYSLMFLGISLSALLGINWIIAWPLSLIYLPFAQNNSTNMLPTIGESTLYLATLTCMICTPMSRILHLIWGLGVVLSFGALVAFIDMQHVMELEIFSPESAQLNDISAHGH